MHLSTDGCCKHHFNIQTKRQECSRNVNGNNFFYWSRRFPHLQGHYKAWKLEITIKSLRSSNNTIYFFVFIVDPLFWSNLEHHSVHNLVIFHFLLMNSFYVRNKYCLATSNISDWKQIGTIRLKNQPVFAAHGELHLSKNHTKTWIFCESNCSWLVHTQLINNFFLRNKYFVKTSNIWITKKLQQCAWN